MKSSYQWAIAFQFSVAPTKILLAQQVCNRTTTCPLDPQTSIFTFQRAKNLLALSNQNCFFSCPDICLYRSVILNVKLISSNYFVSNVIYVHCMDNFALPLYFTCPWLIQNILLWKFKKVK